MDRARVTVNQETAADRRITQVLIAIGIINLVLVLPLWWREGAWGSAWLVPELGLLPLLALWPTARRSRWLPWVLAAMLALAFAALLGDALVRAVFSRPLNILLDPWLLRAGFHLLDGSLGTAAAVLAALLAALGIAAITIAMRALVLRVAGAAPRQTPLSVAVIAAVAVLGLAGIFLAPAESVV